MGWDLVVGFAFGILIATLTVPVGVSGAVSMLPVQLSVLGVPSPSVTPTSLLYNVVAVPGALVCYRRSAGLWTDLCRLLIIGTIPGAIVGAVIRVYLLPNGTLFEVLIAIFLLPPGVWLLIRDHGPRQHTARSSPALPQRRLDTEGWHSRAGRVANGYYLDRSAERALGHPSLTGPLGPTPPPQAG